MYIIHIGSKFGPWGFRKHEIKRMEGFKWLCSHVWNLHIVFNFIQFGF